MTRHYPDLGSASDWLNQLSHGQSEALPRSCHPYGISALVSQTLFGGETSGSVAIEMSAVFSAIQEVFVKVNSAQFNPSGFLSAKFPACPEKNCLLNPLRTNIHMQIILTDLHIFLRKLVERIR